MPERPDDLAIPLDATARERLEHLLVARLTSTGASAARAGADAPVVSPEEIPMVDTDPMRHRSRPRLLVAAIALSVLLVVVALLAVVRSRIDQRPVGPVPSGPAPAILGPVRRASGPAVKIGFVADRLTAGGTPSGAREAAHAAAAYVNERLGGIGGRPIELVDCIVQVSDSATEARNCVSTLRTAGVLAILLGPTAQGNAVDNVAAPAGVPLMTFDDPTTAGLNPGSYHLGDLRSAAVPIVAGRQAGRRTALVLASTVRVPDTSTSALALLEQTLEPLYQANGFEVTFAGLPPDDVASSIASSVQKGPDQIDVYAPTGGCRAIAEAIRSLGYRGAVNLFGTCADEARAEPASAASFAGMRIVLDHGGDDDPEMQRFAAVLDRYGVAGPYGSAPRSAYTVVLGFARAMTGAAAPVDRAAVAAALGAMPSPQPAPLVNGASFRCHAHSTFAGGYCGAGVVAVGTVGADGRIAAVDLVDVSGVPGFPDVS